MNRFVPPVRRTRVRGSRSDRIGDVGGWVTAVWLFLILGACADSTGPRTNEGKTVASVDVTPVRTVLGAIGGTAQLSATAHSASGSAIGSTTFSWSSSDPAIVAVDGTGVVTAVSNGTAVITARADGVEGSATVVVEQVATDLAFRAQPSASAVGVEFPSPVEVVVQDSGGTLVESANVDVRLELEIHPGGGVLEGQTTAAVVEGVAVFGALSIDEVGLAYRLTATAPGVTPATSAPFDVFFPFASVSAGGGYSCGVTPSGEGYCWGLNDAGQLGDGTTTDRVLPVAVSGGLSFASIHAGSSVTCGITVSDVAYCWGANNSGQLGDGTTVDRNMPVAVAGGLTFSEVSSYGSHTCGVTTSQAAYCWGWDGAGQLGDGTPDAAATPTPAPVSGGMSFAHVTVGSSHTCALTPAGVAYCWGWDEGYGQLGTGDPRANSAVPVAVDGGYTFATIAARGHSTCALTVEGMGYCWGDNRGGQLGDGTREIRTSPVGVLGGLTFSALRQGCGVADDGLGYCWGGGIAEFNPPVEPELIAGDIRFADVSPGGNHDCGVGPAGAAYCWGASNWGQLGDGSTDFSRTPVRVMGPT